MGQYELVRVSWKKANGGVVEGYFIKHKKGYIKVRVDESEFYEEFPTDANIDEVEINLLGKLKSTTNH